MKTFRKFLTEDLGVLTESYINLIGPKTNDEREKYADQVWDLLQKSYADIGGIHGNGFSSKQDMINNIKFWKLSKSGDKITSAIMYKDKNGRKAVALGTDGSNAGKKALFNTLGKEFSRGYAELSGPALHAAVKTLGDETAKAVAMDSDDAADLLGKDVTHMTKNLVGSLNDDDIKTWNKYGKLFPKSFYLRKIGQEMHLKMILGVPGIKIK